MTSNDFVFLNINNAFKIGINSMKMRWIMIPVKHPDDNPKEVTNLWHKKILDA